MKNSKNIISTIILLSVITIVSYCSVPVRETLFEFIGLLFFFGIGTILIGSVLFLLDLYKNFKK